MKFTLIRNKTNPKSYCWELDIGDEILFKSQFFDSFIDAIRNLENFHLGLFSIPVVDDNNNLLCPHESNPDNPHSLLLRITQKDDQRWMCEICTLTGEALTALGPFNTKDHAICYSSAFVMDIYTDATVTDQHGSMPPVLSFSRRYRDTFGIVDTHPSACRH
ncbi:Uncharacterised protein [Edwardsiella tarda]|uniref:Uncharacterized protein n=1 Tax=Edwardsiella tarda ATCC 15947 = NBRC 105688 TaxID=667121 RepID=A0AC61THS4_EDWTA|nr:hypothetical protein [Edwardsiella tarda]UAL56672.1 hypothetical protein K8O98_01450 [Edwardsiella tarda]UCQ00275.1 hypothetical protein DCL27_00215 [Edwardsiella tarda ATCC 15947 = NBRC 105688]STD27871.1 Uncharacterised protein [Edwardsiella tarda]